MKTLQQNVLDKVCTQANLDECKEHIRGLEKEHDLINRKFQSELEFRQRFDAMMGLPDVIQDIKENLIAKNQNRIEEMTRMHDTFLTRIKSIEEQHGSDVKI